jgi:hypothetical protein
MFNAAYVATVEFLEVEKRKKHFALGRSADHPPHYFLAAGQWLPKTAEYFPLVGASAFP